jgi:hypothetical protein
MTDAEVHLKFARAHLESAEAQLTSAETPLVSADIKSRIKKRSQKDFHACVPLRYGGTLWVKILVLNAMTKPRR